MGVDISTNMPEWLRKRRFLQIAYVRAPLRISIFLMRLGIILSSLAFHYVADYETLVRKLFKMPSRALATAEHPVFTAYGTQQWYYDDNGQILHFCVTDTFLRADGPRRFCGTSHQVPPDADHLSEDVFSTGFVIRDVVEPQPPESMKDILDG